MGNTTGLADEQRRTLAALKRTPTLARFYLAGGSAVACHLGHRRSNDLDLFSVDPEVDLETVSASLAGFTDFEVVSKTEVVLKLRIGGTAVDVVRYAYPLLEAPSAGPEDFAIAGLLDLATMKLAAIASRGIRRDFWDLHEILTRADVGLGGALDGYVRRFGVAESDLYHVLRSLTYFEDAERDEAMPAGLAASHWRTIREYFQREAPEELRRRAAP